MADIRIKDITTTASSTASGDFFVIDGTTGTRKVNAFNPSFGGNATVTGTLTVNSTFASSASGTTLTSQFANTLTGAANILNLQLRRGDSANGFSRLMWTTGSTTEWSLGSRSGDTNLYLYDEVANAERLKIASSTGNVTIPATTASSSTSTGALVVGGGVGVGGSINVGGNATVFGASGITINNVGGLGSDSVLTLTQSGVSNAFIKNTATTGDIAIGDGGGTYLRITKGVGVVSVLNSTASTSTSSGALVVSGGVGVAKRIHSGEGLTTGGDNETHISFVRNGTVSIGPTSSAAPKLSISSAVVLAAATQSLAAWGDIGAQFAVSGSVLTDTQSSGTVSRCVLNSFASTNVAAAGATTFTQAATLFVAGGPTAGTNVTITNAYAIYTAGGRINFQGLPTSSAGLQAGTLWNDSGTLKVA